MKSLIKEKRNNQEIVFGFNALTVHEYWNTRRRYTRIGGWEPVIKF